MRSLHLGLTWETLPQKVILCDTNGLMTARYVMTSVYEGGCPVTDKACVCIGTNGNSAALWAQGEALPKRVRAKQQAPSWLREGAGVMALLVFIALCSFMGGWLGLGTGLLIFPAVFFLKYGLAKAARNAVY